MVRCDTPLQVEAVSTALLGKSARTRKALNRLDEAVAVCDDVMERNFGIPRRKRLNLVASALAIKSTLLVGLNRTDEAMAVWEEIIKRFETSALPTLRNAAESALSKRAGYELTRGSDDGGYRVG